MSQELFKLIFDIDKDEQFLAAKDIRYTYTPMWQFIHFSQTPQD